MRKNELRTQEMKKLRFEDRMTLQEIADKYGVTRERVRQIVGNSGFTAIQTRKKNNLRIYEQFKRLSNSALKAMMGINSLRNYRHGENTRHQIDGGNLQIGTYAEDVVSKKLTNLGIKNQLMPHRHPFDILLDNGLKIDVKSSDPITNAKTVSSLYTFRTKKDVKGNYCDFLILYLRDINEYFVVPMNKAGNIIRFCYPEGSARVNKRISKWLKYHDRFELLKS